MMLNRLLTAFFAVQLVLLHQGSAQSLHNVPGTPVSGYVNPGTPRVDIVEGGSIGVQPVVDNNVSPPRPFCALAGDVVFLQDAAAGTTPSNWSAVVEFFNPGDPDGMLNLAADYYQTFRPNNTPGGFANLALLPHTIYVSGPAGANEAAIAVYQEFGPSGQIRAGQLAVFTLIAEAQPDAVPEPSAWAAILVGGFLALVLHRRSC